MSNQPKFVISIDPGVKGAVAVMTSDLSTLVGMYDIQAAPNSAGDNRVLIKPLMQFLEPYAASGAVACIESIIVMARNGLRSAKTIATNFAFILAALDLLSIPVTEISPKEWKKRLDLDSDKVKSLDLAASLFPESISCVTKRHDRAEAALIAHAVFGDLQSIS